MFSRALAVIGVIFSLAFIQLPFASAATYSDCRGVCQHYAPGDACPSGMEWDHSAICPMSERDLRCCNPTGDQTREPQEEEEDGSGGFDETGLSGDEDEEWSDEDIADELSDDDGNSNSSSSSRSGSSSNSRTQMSTGAWNRGINTAGQASGLPDGQAEDVLHNLLQWLLMIFIILAVISFVVSGVMFLMAGVHKDMAEKAKKAVGYSIIGLVIAFSALIIVNLVFGLL